MKIACVIMVFIALSVSEIGAKPKRVKGKYGGDVDGPSLPAPPKKPRKNQAGERTPSSTHQQKGPGGKTSGHGSGGVDSSPDPKTGPWISNRKRSTRRPGQKDVDRSNPGDGGMPSSTREHPVEVGPENTHDTINIELPVIGDVIPPMDASHLPTNNNYPEIGSPYPEYYPDLETGNPYPGNNPYLETGSPDLGIHSNIGNTNTDGLGDTQIGFGNTYP